MALKAELLPSSITWGWWKAFVTDFVRHVDINGFYQINQPYLFGELPIDRVNQSYRIYFFHTNFITGYWHAPTRYIPFSDRTFSWVLISFVFLSVILSAMQIGVDLRELAGNLASLHASHEMVLFSMTSVLAVVSTVGIWTTAVLVFNTVATVRHAKSEQRYMRKWEQEKTGFDGSA